MRPSNALGLVVAIATVGIAATAPTPTLPSLADPAPRTPTEGSATEEAPVFLSDGTTAAIVYTVEYTIPPNVDPEIARRSVSDDAASDFRREYANRSAQEALGGPRPTVSGEGWFGIEYTASVREVRLPSRYETALTTPTGGDG